MRNVLARTDTKTVVRVRAEVRLRVRASASEGAKRKSVEQRTLNRRNGSKRVSVGSVHVVRSSGDRERR